MINVFSNMRREFIKVPFFVGNHLTSCIRIK
jgi:hypothetical protein